MSYLSRHPQYLKLVQLSQAEISAPTPAQLADHTTIYQLNVAPYTRYISDSTGTTFVLSGETGNSSVDVSTVQIMINAASVIDKARANHTGNDPASNVVLSTGETVEAAIASIRQQLSGGGASAPVISTDPTINDTTPNVGQSLTFTIGTTSGSHTDYFRVNVAGIDVTGFQASTTAYIVQVADTGKTITVTQRSYLTGSTTVFSERTSAVTSAVAATVPTNSVVPAVTPSGSQAIGTLLTSTAGTWTRGGFTFVSDSYQWLLNGVAISGATSSTYTLLAGQEGGSVVCQVIDTTTQGPSVAASSNTITVTGSASLTEVTAPAFPSTVTVGTAATITNSTWSATPDSTRTTRVYIDSMTTPYVVITGATAVYTPLNDAWLSSQTTTLSPPSGLTDLTGHTVYCDQQVTYFGNTYTSSKSAGKVVQASSATLAAQTALTGIVWTQNTAITTVKPVTASGGTAPYTYLISPALPSGLSFNTSTGFITGTPTVTSNQTTYTVIVTDAVAASANSTFTARTDSASSTVTTMASISAANTFASSDGYVQLLGTSYTLSGINESTGITGTGTIVIPGGASTMRFGKVIDPLNASRSVFSCAAKVSDGTTFGHYGRVEIGLNQTASAISKTGTYWFAFENYISATRWASGNGIIFQIHNSDPTSVHAGPITIEISNAGAVFTNKCVLIDVYAFTDAVTGEERYPWCSNNPGFGASSTTIGQSMTYGTYAIDAWHKWVIKYTGSNGGGSSGYLGVWLDGVQILNLTSLSIGTATPGYPSDYPKCGMDDNPSGGGANGAYMLVRSLHSVLDAGYTYAQIATLLT
jgi:hypothetical protein